MPREAVDEFLRRGHGMVRRLADIVSDSATWDRELPAWWAPVHAVYILGALAPPSAALPLLKALRHAEAYQYEWIIEELPSIFGIIGTPALEGLKKIAADITSTWRVRTIAIEGLAAVALEHPDVEQDVFGFIHALLADPAEDRSLRQMAGHVLLDFQREECRIDLMAFGKEERRLVAKDSAYPFAFSDDEVKEEMGRGHIFTDPYAGDWLAFYDPEAIEERRKHWGDEDCATCGTGPSSQAENGLCPFDSAKKRKKCCLGKAGEA